MQYKHLALACLMTASSVYALEVNSVQVLSQPGQPFSATATIKDSDQLSPNDVLLMVYPTVRTKDLEALTKSINFAAAQGNNNNTIVVTLNSPLPTPTKSPQLILSSKHINKSITASLPFKTEFTGSVNTQNTIPANPVSITTPSIPTTPTSPPPAMVEEKTVALSAPALATTSSAPITEPTATTPEPESITTTSLPTAPLETTAMANTPDSNHSLNTANTSEQSLVPLEQMPPDMAGGLIAAEPSKTEEPATTAAPLSIPVKTTPNKTRTTVKTKTEPKPASTTPTAEAAQTAESVTVEAHDTLWLIARKISHTSGGDTRNVMKSLYAANPSAFIKGNPNRLKANATLVIRDAESLSVAEKKRAERAFNAAYNGEKSNITASTRTTHKKQKHPVLTAKQQNVKVKRKPHEVYTAETAPARQDNLTIVGANDMGQSLGNQATPSATVNTAPQKTPVNTAQLNKVRTHTSVIRQKVRTLVSEQQRKEKQLAIINADLAELEKRLKEKQAKQDQQKKQAQG